MTFNIHSPSPASARLVNVTLTPRQFAVVESLAQAARVKKTEAVRRILDAAIEANADQVAELLAETE